MGRFGNRTASFSYLGENIIKLWVPYDLSQLWHLERRVTGRRRWIQGGPDEASSNGFTIRDPWPSGRWQAPHGEFHMELSSDTRVGSWQVVTPDFCNSLPRDPAELYAALCSASPADREGYCGAFVYAGDGLRSGLLPVDLRAALLDALVLIPGLEYESEGICPDGRSGLSFALNDGIHRREFFLDPHTGQLINERNTLVVDFRDLPAGTATKVAQMRHLVTDEPADPF